MKLDYKLAEIVKAIADNLKTDRCFLKVVKTTDYRLYSCLNKP